MEVQALGNHWFKQGRFAEAEEAYTRAAKLDADFAYAWLMRDLARMRQGKPPGGRSDPRLEKRDPWGGSLLGFVEGRVDQTTLFSRLEPQGGLRYSEEECELYFVLGELALARGDLGEARRDLRSCLGTGITDFVEYTMAWHELKRLDAANPPPPATKSRGGDSMDDEPV
jgi:tetratricopeptide (TPR) repeat protein